MDKTMAKLFSGLFHPILMPFWGVCLMFHSGVFVQGLNSQVAHKLLLVVFISTVALPVLFVPAMIALGLIRDIYMNDRRDRFAPFLVGSFFYFLCFFLFLNREMPRLLTAFILSFALVTLVATVISLRWKVSVHMIGIGGLCALLAYLIYSQHMALHMYLIAGILTAGATAWARLRLRVHSQAQVYTGFFISFIGVLLSFWLY